MSGGRGGAGARRVAVDALHRIDTEGAYANLVLDHVLARSGLEDRDRHFVTDLVYGTTRLRRACDHLVDRHLRGGVAPRVRAVLRMGAYQLGWGGVAPHAAVSATVAVAPRPARGLVNAVLRRVADDVAGGIGDVAWPDLGTELSYPDWIVAEVRRVLGAEPGLAALRAMNEPATTHQRADGYVQDPASVAVTELVGAAAGDRVLDVCSAPGGKATAMAATGAVVVAADRRPGRLGLVAANRDRLGAELALVAADGVSPPFRPHSFDRVLVDAPCTGLGVLRRRPDARWRLDDGAPTRLGTLQDELLAAAARLVAPGGRLVYSVCTLTEREGPAVADGFGARGWAEDGRRLLVPDADHDGMFLVAWTAPTSTGMTTAPASH